MLTWLPLSDDIGLIGAFALHLTCGLRPGDRVAGGLVWPRQSR
jgi:hypothetical protein